MMEFISQFFRNPAEVGSVAPSSNALGRLIASRIPRCSVLVEIGAGTGAITEHIKNKGCRFIVIESNPKFNTDLYSQGGYEVVGGHGQDVRIPSGAVVVSTVPLKSIGRENREKLLENIARSRPELFVQISYFYPTDYMDEYFEGEWKLCFWNIPPTWVFFGRGFHPNFYL